MTFVGKVLVVVQVVLSICFMAFAGAVVTAHTNWKAAHDTLQQDHAKLQAELADKTQEFKDANDALTKQLSDSREEVANLKSSVVPDLQRELKVATDELQQEKDAHTTEQALAERFTIEAGFRKLEAVGQRDRVKTLLQSREELVAQVQNMLDEKFNRETEMKKMVEKHNEVLAENATMRKIIAANGFSTDLRDYENKQAPPPDVKGLVLYTQRGKRSGTEFITISIGSDDGLLEGHDLFIYRTVDGGKYLGKINVVYVEPDRAVGIVVQSARNGTIQRGDNVTTKL